MILLLFKQTPQGLELVTDPSLVEDEDEPVFPVVLPEALERLAA
jgi:hypothetical protein